MKEKPTLFVAIGLPASGKSTGALHTKAITVSTDSIRKKLYGDESVQGDGKLVFDTAYDVIEANLKMGYDVYFDATNVNRKSRRKLFNKFGRKAKMVAMYYNTPIAECMARNAARSRHVPEDVIIRMNKNLTPPHKSEGWDEIFEIGG